MCVWGGGGVGGVGGALISAVNQYLRRSSTSWFKEGIQKLQQRWPKCLEVQNVGGEYFEKEQKNI